jgi:hypothetical protein
MIPNIRDAASGAPRLRLDLNLGTLLDLPAWSLAPATSVGEMISHLSQTPYEGIQTSNPRPIRAAGLPATATARLYESATVFEIAKTHREDGADATTLIVGTGLESDAEIAKLADAIIEASERLSYPLFLETHRGTITQDIRRTVDLVRQFPDLRFNGDFSHWYTGHALSHERFAEKLEFLSPVFERTRFLHGRVGTSGSVQVAIVEEEQSEHVGHFRAFWTQSFIGFLRSAAPGDVIVFAPELLPARLSFQGKWINVNYARTFDVPGVGRREESDRWQQALVLCRLAEACFADAQVAIRSA